MHTMNLRDLTDTERDAAQADLHRLVRLDDDALTAVYAARVDAWENFSEAYTEVALAAAAHEARFHPRDRLVDLGGSGLSTNPFALPRIGSSANLFTR
jgi:hypothetical protein